MSGTPHLTPVAKAATAGIQQYFLDLLKYPDSFEHKPVAYVGEASGTWGGLRAVEQLQMVFGYRHAHSYPVRVFIPGVNKLFDAAGTLTDAAVDLRLADQVRGFAQYIKRLAHEL